MAATSSVSTASTSIEPSIKQFTRRTVLEVWVAAALPMGALAWLVAPTLAGPAPTARRFTQVLITVLRVGLVWQFLLVVFLVARERNSLRWPIVRDALWLRPPSTRSRRGGLLWLWGVLPFVGGFFALQLLPLHIPTVASHDFGAFQGSAAGRATLHGNWGLFAIIVVMFVFNTVLGEELLFRGLLLPRMQNAFGRGDWIVNGLFGAYHLHQPWSIPANMLVGLLLAYPSRRFRSAWLGILIHSTQSVYLLALVLVLLSH
jgi:membrane protease YdiL (CAAX protease family)